MEVGLIDVDNRDRLNDCFPNLALMKLSSWHKKQDDTVQWYEPLEMKHYDRVYMSKIFSFTEDYPYYINADEVMGGGLVTVSVLLMERNCSTSPKIFSFLMRWSIRFQTMVCTALRIPHMDSCQEAVRADVTSAT